MAKIDRLLSKSFIVILQGYRFLLSPFLGQHCRFYPSCSRYAQDAVAFHGLGKGGWLAAKRLMCCHPFHPGGYDPVPKE